MRIAAARQPLCFNTSRHAYMVLFCALSFLLGLRISTVRSLWPIRDAHSNETILKPQRNNSLPLECSREINALRKITLQQRQYIEKLESTLSSLKLDLNKTTVKLRSVEKLKNPKLKITKPPSNPFTTKVSNFMAGAARILTVDLLEQFDPGIPHKTYAGNEEAFIFYGQKEAIPKRLRSNFDRLEAKDALSNCESVEIIVRSIPMGFNSCFALMGNADVHFVPTTYRWITKKSLQNEKDASNNLFELAGRGMNAMTEYDFLPIDIEDDTLKSFRKQLIAYLSILDDAVIPLIRPVLEDKATEMENAGKTLIITVTNYGQSDLLHNFVCACQANHLDISNFVIFCTDEESLKKATSIGLTAIYHQDLFGALPENDSKKFGDATFTAMVFAKIVVAHLVSVMGYSFLYQDLDIVWYHDPFSHFANHNLIEKVDILVQDDGGRTPNYAPYFANSGFFFAKSNPRTKYFFQRLLYNAEYITPWKSDQAVFNAILPEVVSFVGLTVKTLGFHDFPGGRTYQDPEYYDFMKDIALRTHTPIIYHMHWTINKEQKVEQMKQMGMWYLRIAENNTICADEPEVECFHWNRPSMKVCETVASMTKDDAIDQVYDVTTRFWPEDSI
jgi:Nucleotide-diphospho-sugar transferase